MKCKVLSAAALVAVSGVRAQITSTIVTVIIPTSTSAAFDSPEAAASEAAYLSLLSVDRSELAAATSSTLQPIQETALNAALSAFETGAFASLTSDLATEIPRSILTKYLSIGYSSLEARYNSSFTEQSWFSAIENVHTQVQNAIVTIEAGVLTLTANSTSSTAIPTTGAATVTQANLTSTVSVSSAGLTAIASGQSGSGNAGVSAGGSATASSSSGSGAVPTGMPKAIMGMAGVAAGVLGVAAML